MTRDGMGATGLDERVSAAYAAMGPSEQVRERVLESLLEEEPPQVYKQTRLMVWHFAVPLALAASIAAVALLVRPAPESAPTKMQSNADVTVQTEGQDMAFEEEMVATSEAAAPESLAERYPIVEFSDGTRFGVGDVATESVDTTVLVSATAIGADGDETTSCEVAEDRYVRFPDDDTWYELVRD